MAHADSRAATRGAEVEMPNIHEPDFDEIRGHPGFECRRARIGRQAGARSLGLSLFELPPGTAAYPYHFHLAEEEIIVVLAGTATLRDPNGWRELAAGEVVDFPTGEAGAHQIVNRGRDPVRFLAFSTSGVPDVCVYPDSNKIGAFERRPEGGGLRALFRSEDAVDYWDREQTPDVGDHQ